MRADRALAPLLALLASACESPLEDAVADVVTIQTELAHYYADFSERDWEAFADHFWPGAILTTVWQPPGESAPRVVATNVPDFVRQAPAGPGSKAIFAESPTRWDTRVTDDDLAQVLVHYDARFGDPGDVREWTGVDAFTLLRHEGRWRITSLAWTADE